MVLHMRKLISVLMALILMVSAAPVFADTEECMDSQVQVEVQKTDETSQVEVTEEPESQQEEAAAETETSQDKETVFGTGSSSECAKAEVNIYDQQGEMVLEKEPVELDPEMTLKEIIAALDEEGHYDYSWDECAYFINSEEIEDINIEQYKPVSGDRIEIYAPATDTVGNTELSALAEEMETMELAPKTVSKAYKKASEKIYHMASSDNWSFENEWSVICLARADQMNKKDADKYCEKIASYLAAQKSSKLSSTMSSVNSRLVISLTSLGYDARNVNGKNLLEPLADMNYVTKQGINGPVFALLAFDSHSYDIPKAKGGKKQTTREELVNILVKAQLGGKGWAYSGSAADVDMTAMVIQALTPYYSSNQKAREAVDNALGWLAEIQNKDGSFSSGSGKVSSESQAQVLVALTGLGIDPEKDERFVKNGKGVIDALMSFNVSSGGFKHIASGSGANGLATQQAYYALVAYYRAVNGKSSLYDMNDIQLRKFTAKAKKGDTGTSTTEEKTAGKAMGKTRSLGFLSLGKGKKAKAGLITETEGIRGTTDAVLTEKEYNAMQERERLKSTLPWIYMAVGALAALALVLLLRERNKLEK